MRGVTRPEWSGWGFEARARMVATRERDVIVLVALEGRGEGRYRHALATFVHLAGVSTKRTHHDDMIEE